MAKIAVFDSGIGGINILKALLKELPENEYIYIADTKNAPYGTQSQEKIIRYCFEIGEICNENSIDILVIACNTATAVAVDDMRQKFYFQIVGVEPELKTALNLGGKTLLMLTPLAAESARIDRLKQGREIEIWADPSLATRIEKAAPDFELLSEYVKRLPQADNYVLGCTHYLFLKDLIIKCFPESKIFDGLNGVTKRVKEIYKKNEFKPSVFTLKIIDTQSSEHLNYLSLIF